MQIFPTQNQFLNVPYLVLDYGQKPKIKLINHSSWSPYNTIMT